MEDILAIVFIFGGGSLFLLAVSPVGRAIADRIRGAGTGLPRDVADRIRDSQIEMMDEVESLRREVTELGERLDFTERVLAQQREPPQLPPNAQAPDWRRNDNAAS
jgi:hypothetical protein